MIRPGAVLRPRVIDRAMLRAYPARMFLFGDNLLGVGLGGQARAMRGEPNAFGVPTKRAPGRLRGDYFTDADWSDATIRHAIIAPFNFARVAVLEGRTIVIPWDGIGTGLAELGTRAPRILRAINAHIALLEELAR